MSLMLALALAAAPAPVMASVPVACVYDNVRKSDWDLLVKVARNGLNGTTSAEKDQVSMIGEAAQRCRMRYGWSEVRMNIAIRYFVGRVLASNSTHDLKQYGFDYPQLKQLVAALDAPTQAAYVAGQVNSDQTAATFAALSTIGIDFNAIPAEAKQGFAQKLSQGILGLLVEQQAEAAYAAS